MRLAIKMMLGVILLMKLMTEGINAKTFLVETADNNDRGMTGNTESLVQVYVRRFCVRGPWNCPYAFFLRWFQSVFNKYHLVLVTLHLHVLSQ